MIMGNTTMNGRASDRIHVVRALETPRFHRYERPNSAEEYTGPSKRLYLAATEDRHGSHVGWRRLRWETVADIVDEVLHGEGAKAPSLLRRHRLVETGAHARVINTPR